MANLKNTTISDTGSLQIPIGTTAERPASPVEGAIRYNTTLAQAEYYDGLAWRPISDSNPEATGGTIVDIDIGGTAYRVHYFTTVGNSTFTVSKGGEAEILVVAGGGGSGGGGNSGYHGGGGGGGGVVYSPVYMLTPRSYTITVGDGGTAGTQTGDSGFRGGNGGNSAFDSLVAIGGGGGGGNSQAGGANGGSGGGGNLYAGAGGASNQTTYADAVVFGNSGGQGQATYGSSGGGGGAGGAGSAGVNNVGGQGGPGIANSITGSVVFYGGGGGGAGNTAQAYPAAGSSAGYVQGAPNTGQGAGGRQSIAGLVGGSGVVIVRYRKNATTAISANRTQKSLLPYASLRRAENLFLNRSGQLLHVDAGNTASYPGTGTTLTDLSGNGFNGTLMSTPIFVNQSQGYINLDGGNDYIEFASPSDRFAWTPSGYTNNSISIEIWLRAIDTDGWFISKPWNGSGQYNYYITNGAFYAEVTQGATLNFTGFTLNKWEYICAVITPTRFGVYRNGVINAGFSNHGITSNTASSGNSNLPLTWGTLYPYGSANPSFTPNQDVAILRVYNRALSADEVAVNYAAECHRFGV